MYPTRDLTTNEALPYPCSLVVISLYTTIPIQEAITNVTDRIQNPTHHLSNQDISDLLQVTLNNMYFSFRDGEKSLPMGSKISGILAILFMDKLETITLTSHLITSPYKRYVDEIYIQTTNEETADYFHHIINNVHPNLKFELKSQKQHQVSHYIKDGNSSFEFYRKPVKKPLFVHHQSAISTKSKLNFIHNERKRIENRCSSHISATQHLNKFHDILRLNGYSENSIEQSKHPQHPQRNPQPAKIERSYLKIPFTSKRLSHKITNIFRKKNIPVRFSHKSYTLKQALSHTFKVHKCIRDKMPYL